MFAKTRNKTQEKKWKIDNKIKLVFGLNYYGEFIFNDWFEYNNLLLYSNFFVMIRNNYQ